MKNGILIIGFWLLMIMPVQAQIHLKGIVTNDGCMTSLAARKGCKTFKRVRVSVGAASDVTDDNGRFLIILPKKYLPGNEVITTLNVDGYAIHMPLYGRFNLPNQVWHHVFEQQIILLPKGSLKFLDNASLVNFIENISQRESNKLKLASEKKKMDFQAYIKEYADYHGLTIDNVIDSLDRWAEISSNDFKEQGAKAFYLHEFSKSSALFEKGAILKGRNLQKQLTRTAKRIEKERMEIEAISGDFVLAANSSMKAYDFKNAIRLYAAADSVLTLASSLRERYGDFPESKAQVRALIGVALWNEGTRIAGSASNDSLLRSEEAFREALKFYTRTGSPVKWAEIQNNLGIVFRAQANRADGVRAGRLFSQSEQAYRAALEIFTKEKFPEKWAATQTNVGNVLFDQGTRRSGPESIRLLEDAIKAHRYSLEVRSRDKMDEGYASTLNNLGIALRALAIRSEPRVCTRLLKEAENYYREALKVRTREKLPQQWAATQNNLAAVLSDIGLRADSTEKVYFMEQSVIAYRSVLQVRTKEDLPQDWAATQINLGNVLGYLGLLVHGDRSIEVLQQSIVAYLSALEIYRKESSPQYWAQAQNNLGGVYTDLAARVNKEKSTKLQAEALKAFLAALEVRTKESLPQQWAEVQYNLGLLYEQMQEWEKAILFFESSRSMNPLEIGQKVEEIKSKIKKAEKGPLSLYQKMYPPAHQC